MSIIFMKSPEKSGIIVFGILEEIKNLNRPITCAEIETVILKTSSKQKSRPDGFTGKF